jgi:iron(III) transport system permease protein
MQALPDYRLARGWGIASTIWCLLPVALGFGLPAVVLCNYAAEFYAVTLEADYFRYVWNSVRLATWAAAVAAGLGILLAYGARLAPRRTIRGLAEFATVGYAVPGAVLAVGILVPLGHVDNALDELSRSLFDAPLGLLISGTATGLVVGYVVRFLALSYRTVDASLARITPSMDGAARTLGCGAGAALRRVHLPLVRPSVITAALLVFVDTMKELPLTLILRPFDFDTLATFVYQYASDELLEESALGALTIVAAGVIPVLLMSQTIAHSRPGHR